MDDYDVEPQGSKLFARSYQYKTAVRAPVELSLHRVYVSGNHRPFWKDLPTRDLGSALNVIKDRILTERKNANSERTVVQINPGKVPDSMEIVHIFADPSEPSESVVDIYDFIHLQQYDLDKMVQFATEIGDLFSSLRQDEDEQEGLNVE